MANQFSEKSSINRQLALDQGLSTYHGTPCKNCGETEKKVKSYSCIKCHRERSLAQLADSEKMAKYRTREKHRIRQIKWRKENPEKAKAQSDRAKDYRIKYCANPINKEKSRKRSLLKHYGISLEDYNSMLESQNYSCKLCEKHQNLCKKKLAVDHNHDTGKIRGLLCHDCNTGIGLLKDDILMLKKAIIYLESELC